MDEESGEQRSLGGDNERVSAEEMDERRQQNIAYEYLCHLEEAKVWIESCLKEELPPTTEFEEYIRNGVCLAKLGNFFAPKIVPLRKIYDIDLINYKKKGLHFRHTDNIHHWLAAVHSIGLPEAIVPETTDVYDKKNMPRVVYCLHALSLFLHKLGLAPEIQDLFGKVNFTEEEISAMHRELEKYGIQMPVFGTIGGILENEMPVDEASMHAAVIAINETIDRQDTQELLSVLQNPCALLQDIKSSAIDLYQDILVRTKMEKVENRRNRALGLQEVHDVYDEMLTRCEIQQCLNQINSEVALQSVKEFLENHDNVSLLKILNMSALGLKNVLPKNVELYIKEISKLIVCNPDNDSAILLTKENVQEALHSANEIGDAIESRNYAIKAINDAIDRGCSDELLRALKCSEAQLPPVLDFAADLYLLEFSNIRQENGANLKYEELNGGIIVLSAVAMVNFYAEAGDPEATYSALTDDNVHLIGVESDCKLRYQTVLLDAKKQKSMDSSTCPFLTHLQIQECIIIANQEVQEEHDKISAIQDINDALRLDDPQITLDSLRSPVVGLRNVNPASPILYHHMLLRELAVKATEIKDPDEYPSLWIDEIQHVVDKSNKLAQIALSCCQGVAEINIAIDQQNMEKFYADLFNPDVHLLSIVPACMETYLKSLTLLKAEKSEKGHENYPWIEYKSKEGIVLHYNLKTEEAHWTSSQGGSTTCLSKDEIQSVICTVTSEYDRQLMYDAVEPQILQLQALVRGFLFRRIHKKRLEFLHSQKDSVLKIQAWWKCCKQRKIYRERIFYLKDNISKIVKVQSMVRRYLAMKKYCTRQNFYKNNVRAIIKIQTNWRACKTRKAFQDLRNSDKPAFQSVQMFVHLLDINNLDFSEELELTHLKGEVVKTIRHNQQLEKDLTTMDIKIGLLVKNRITLQDVVAHGFKMDKKSKESREAVYGITAQHGLKTLSKDSRLKVEAYQHLFYLIQTEPRYLSHLVTFMLPSAKTKFIESIVLTLFNYASNQREEYLLLKLFQAALQEEISSRVDQPSDIITANSLIIKMIVGFNRNKRGQSSLREILSPLVQAVLDNKKLQINTNPVEVYKAWVNKLESKTGELSGLPYTVTQEDALKHEDVITELKESLICLKETTLLFFNSIVSSLDKLPYGILYMCKVLKNSLESKFPDAPQKEILKIVGNLLYYRYINSAIVAPDAFDIVDVGVTQALSIDQRRNLGSIAKILQFATSKTGFGEDSPHLISLNSFIIECHDKFKNFFEAACSTEELEDHFKIDEYTEATMMTKPVVYISLQDICGLHQLLLEHENFLAPDPEDRLHELLEDLGEKPSVEALIGETLDNLSSVQLSKTEVCLMLTNKFEIPESTKTEINRLYVRTKQMIVDAMHCIEVADIPEMLKSKIGVDQSKKYVLLLEKRLQQNEDEEKEKKQRILHRTPSDVEKFTLEEVVDKIRHNLNLLELEGYVSSKNDYQDIINAISLDIRNKRRYRMRRKQDLMQLKTTLTNLQTKRSFFEDQVDYYNQYIKQCLDNMATGKKKLRRSSSLFTRSFISKTTLKYTAAKLHEKGIIISMEGLSKNQFKNVLFEITPTEVSGVFTVKVKYMGTNLSDVELDIQNLLELQYEGRPVMKMFDRAEVNVNLLLYLLNSKFYGKSK